MAKELFEGIYSSHKIVFIERVEKNLQFYLKNKIVNIKKAGQEVIVEVDKKDLKEVLFELKNNTEFEIEILNSINYFKSKNNYYVLLSLASVSNNFSMLLKVKCKTNLREELFESPPSSDSQGNSNRPGRSGNIGNIKNTNNSTLHSQINSGFKTTQAFLNEYNEINTVISEFYPNAVFYKKNDNLRKSFNDIIIKSQILDGLDVFDIYAKNYDDKIDKSYLDLNISEIYASSPGIFNNIDVTKLLTIISRLDYSAGIFPELCLVLAVEDLLQIKIPKKIFFIRMLVSELFRISNHLYYVSKISLLLGMNLCLNRALIERERILRIIESITGSRIHPNYIRIGAVAHDLPSEKLLNIKNELKVLIENIDNLETLLLDNTIVTAKLKDIGIVNKNTAIKFGLTGPNLRSCGMRYDLRKNRNLLLYKEISFLVPIGKYGDCLERVQIRFNEMYQSAKIISQILGQIPEEKIKKILSLKGVEIKRTDCLASVECPHGVYKLFFEIEDNIILNLVPITSAKNSIFCAQVVLEENKPEDIDLILASFDISGSELLQGLYL